MMKNIILTLVFAAFSMLPLAAQNTLNNNADNIVGTYSSSYEGFPFHVRIFKMTDGTYRGQVVWMQYDKDADGNKLLDRKNPDKSMRSTPLDKVLIIKGLRYNAKKKRWDGGKIYDPVRGIWANATVNFEDDGRLRVKGSLMGISESVYWEKIKK